MIFLRDLFPAVANSEKILKIFKRTITLYS